MSSSADGSYGKPGGKNGGNSSYALLPSDRKAVSVARDSADKSKNQIAESKKDFAGRSSLGLWWDAKGIFSSSNVADVTEHMERYRKFYEGVATFTEMVEKGDTSSYDSLLDLYEELSEMEMDAQRDVKNNKSKAICEVLRNFLGDKYRLDHNLKKVECVVLKQKIGEVEQTCERSRAAVSKIGEDMNKILEENKKIKEFVKESSDRAKELQVENQTFKSLVERLSKEKEEFKVAMEREKEEFKETMERKMEELSLKADKRCEAVRRDSDKKLKEFVEEAEKRAEERCQKMAEQSKRQIQRISQMLEDMKFNNIP